MKERFKRYLEREFRAIAPTKAAMEYRNDMLRQMMERVQDLKIKGITDEELIYDMVIDELGDFRATLIEFENKKVKVETAKRKVMLGIVMLVGTVLLITAAYLITSFALGDAWGKTWLIMVGGIFAGVCAGSILVAVKAAQKKKYLAMRGSIAVVEVLVTVFVFLLLQILFRLNMSWLAFLVMVIVLVGVDTALAYASQSKIRHIELAAFIEVFCVLLYVILGIVGLAPWHPTWLLCIGGALGIILEIVVLIAKRNKDKDNDEMEKIVDKHVVKDEDYYTMWND